MKVQHLFREHKYIILAAAIMLSVAWVSMMVQLIVRAVHEWQNAQVELVELRAPAPEMHLPMVQGRSRSTATAPTIATSTRRQENIVAMPSAGMQSTSGIIVETSRTHATHVGGGVVSSNGGGNINSTNTANLAMNGATANFTGMIYLNTAHSGVTSVGASSANEVVNEKMGIVAHHTGVTELPGENEGPLSPEDPTPVGDVAWILMILLTTAWCVRVRLKKR